MEHHLIHCEACLQEVIEVTLFLRELNGLDPDARLAFTDSVRNMQVEQGSRPAHRKELGRR